MLGNILDSLPPLDQSIFDDARIIIAEYNVNGATGFITNKLFSRTLNELVEFRNSPSFPIYAGGPMKGDQLYFIHARPDLISGGQLISNGIYLGGDFKQTVAAINDKTITEKQIKIFIGYCGWDPQQLEEEIDEGSWKIVGHAVSDDIF